ncbi:MAG TPA: hypothetical protein VIV27_08070 [Halioglobus sp.]
MDLKNRNKHRLLNAEIWQRHLHWMDRMSGLENDGYARHLARLKSESRAEKSLLQSTQPTKPLQNLFWITGE